MPEIAYVNGEFVPLERAMVHVEDRGFQFADAVYEVLRVYQSKVFAVQDHLARLFRSLEAIGLNHGFTTGQLQNLIEEAARRSQFAEAMVYLQITRGRAPRHRGIMQTTTPTIVITVRELKPPPATLPDTGVKVVTVPDQRWARCDVKSVGLLANVLAYQTARTAGADDAIFVGSEGFVAESTAGNIFVVKAGSLRTPPRGPRLLSGVTRDKIILAARNADLKCAEESVRQEELAAADELFLTSTTSQVVPVTMVDGAVVGNGKPGPVTARVYAAFLKLLPRV